MLSEDDLEIRGLRILPWCRDLQDATIDAIQDLLQAQKNIWRGKGKLSTSFAAWHLWGEKKHIIRMFEATLHPMLERLFEQSGKDPGFLAADLKAVKNVVPVYAWKLQEAWTGHGILFTRRNTASFMSMGNMMRESACLQTTDMTQTVRIG